VTRSPGSLLLRSSPTKVIIIIKNFKMAQIKIVHIEITESSTGQYGDTILDSKFQE
jgi:hypothetical protein